MVDDNLNTFFDNLDNLDNLGEGVEYNKKPLREPNGDVNKITERGREIWTHLDIDERWKFLNYFNTYERPKLDMIQAGITHFDQDLVNVDEKGVRFSDYVYGILVMMYGTKDQISLS